MRKAKKNIFNVKAVLLLAIMILIGCGLSGCGASRETQPISETRLMLDTVCTVTIYDKRDRELLSAALDLCESYEALLSMTVEGSDVWRINHAGGEPVAVSPDTARVIQAGLEYGKLSEGFFDISIGQLSSLWDFTGQSMIPDAFTIDNARKTIDYRKVAVTGDTVQLGHPDAWIDLGAIAKGYIADAIAGFLRDSGVNSALIDLGGNIVTVGDKPDGSPWRVGVTRPFSERGDLVGVVEAGEGSVVSSGVYERQFEFDGAQYHHILNPFTGMPVTTDVIGATIVSNSSMDGDALSTIIILLGSERAAGIISAAPGVKGAVLVLDNGEIQVHGDIAFR